MRCLCHRCLEPIAESVLRQFLDTVRTILSICIWRYFWNIRRVWSSRRLKLSIELSWNWFLRCPGHEGHYVLSLDTNSDGSLRWADWWRTSLINCVDRCINVLSLNSRIFLSGSRRNWTKIGGLKNLVQIMSGLLLRSKWGQRILKLWEVLLLLYIQISLVSRITILRNLGWTYHSCLLVVWIVVNFCWGIRSDI